MKYDYNIMATSRFQSMITDEQLSYKINTIKSLLKECSEIEGGYLYIRHRDGRVNFIEYRDGKHFGITRKMDRVYSLARRDYMKCRIEYLRANVDMAYKRDHGNRIKTAEQDIHSLLKKYSEANLDLRKIVFTKAQYEWQKNPQSMRAFYEAAYEGLAVGESTILDTYNRELSGEVNSGDASSGETHLDVMHYTAGGVAVRTLEEQSIGNMMEAMGMAYRYEPLIEIAGCRYYPSFAIMMENKRIVLIEYIPEITEDAVRRSSFDVSTTVRKLIAYKEANIEIGRDVFIAARCDTEKSYRLTAFLNQIMATTPGSNNVLRNLAEVGLKN